MENKGVNKGYANLIPCKPGETHNPNGRPKGQRNYATIYREALIKIAAANDKTPEEIETMLEEVGIKQGLKGNFQFWKDIRDRLHGTVTQRIDHTTDGRSFINEESEKKAKQAIAEFAGTDNRQG